MKIFVDCFRNAIKPEINYKWGRSEYKFYQDGESLLVDDGSGKRKPVLEVGGLVPRIDGDFVELRVMPQKETGEGIKDPRVRKALLGEGFE